MATLKIDFSKVGVRDLKVKIVPRGANSSQINAVNVDTFYWKKDHPRATPTIVYARGDLTQAPFSIKFSVYKAESCDTSKAVMPNISGPGSSSAMAGWSEAKAKLPSRISNGFYDRFTYQFIDKIVADLNKYYNGTTSAWKIYGALKSLNGYYIDDSNATPYALVIVLSNFGEMLPTNTCTSPQQTAHFFTIPLTFMLAIKVHNNSTEYCTLATRVRSSSISEAELLSNATWVCLQDKRITWQNNNATSVPPNATSVPPSVNVDKILSPYWRNITQASTGQYYMGTFSDLYNTTAQASGYTGNHLGFIPAIARGQVSTTVYVKSIWFGPTKMTSSSSDWDKYTSSSSDWDKYTIARQKTNYDALVYFKVTSESTTQQMIDSWYSAPIMGKEVCGRCIKMQSYYNAAASYSTLKPNSLISALATQSYT